MGNVVRHAALAAIVGYLAWAPVSAQNTAAATIRCPLCPLSGQKPEASAADLSQIRVVESRDRIFFEGRTIQVEIIARVLSVSPFIVELLDAKTQLLDRNMRPVQAVPKTKAPAP
jgi:hypothetical protein